MTARHNPRSPLTLCPLWLILLLLPEIAHAALTETLPKGVFLLDEGMVFSQTTDAYDNDGNLSPLADNIVRYEPGGGLQGVIKINAVARFAILVNQLQYGVLDNLSVGLGIPYVLLNTVDPGLEWEPGDYQPGLGRSYGETDFWEWAESMGQPRPAKWSGNKGALADSYLGMRYRLSDDLPSLRELPFAIALTAFGVIPTGDPPETEEPVSAGTTAWNLHFQGEYGIHVSTDIPLRAFHDRFTVSADFFYEWLVKHTYDTPRGTQHPLIITYEPYVGESYTIDPGDFAGLAVQGEIVAVRGRPRGSWITKGDARAAEKFPPILTLGARYTFTHLAQSDWESNSPLWDWDRERPWRPGYKNILNGLLTLSLMRVGVPMQLYINVRNMTWIPGKNTRAVDAITFGTRIPLKFW